MALVPVSKICGAAVKGADGASLGTITEVMIDHDSGAVGYAVLAVGGVMGVGETLFAVPWAQFAADLDSGDFKLGVAADALKGMSGIDKDAWPAVARERWWEAAR